MKTQDGADVGLLDRDAVFLAEHGIDSKERLDRARLGPVDTSGVTGPYQGDMAYTIYTQARDALVHMPLLIMRSLKESHSITREAASTSILSLAIPTNVSSAPWLGHLQLRRFHLLGIGPEHLPLPCPRHRRRNWSNTRAVW
jgi:hypothetical protein